MTQLKLRDYQAEAIDALMHSWQDKQRLAVVLPTGAGKTVIFAHLAHEHWALERKRTLILVHRDELVNQTVDKLCTIDDEVSVGVVKAERNEIHAPIVVASIQTVSQMKRLRQLSNFQLIICDEAHRSASDSWINVLRALGGFDTDGPRVAGFTATLSRADNRGLGDVWEDVAFARGIKWFIEHGHLTPVVGKAVTTDVELDKIKQTAGDYNERELGVRMATDTVRDAIVRSYTEYAKDRLGVVFAPTVDAAEFFAEGLNAVGIWAEGIYGITPLDERAAIYERYQRGDTQVLTSCTALAEGWDAPWASCAVLARPTMHAGLYIQQIGRVLRPWPGKTDALVLDVSGASERHNLQALIELNETREAEARVPADDEDDEETGDSWSIFDYRGPVAFRDIDLFAGTDAQWLTTFGGVLFVPLHDRLVFLAQRGESWSVGICPKNTMRGGRWLREGLSAEQALAWGGQYAVNLDPTIASRKASWRRGRPSEKQTELAIKLGIDPAGLNKAKLSDAITITLASRTLQRIGNGL